MRKRRCKYEFNQKTQIDYSKLEFVGNAKTAP